ncbi:ARM repeat-containing protein [Pleurotus eryngii]|uniref:ARM repeat-containing protein n=1 Tax=Pleurotus eryngii TaxID=5323 RepID=A0A9P6A8N3_PLEER|nr:ARM repeat-containing protein [Pleurotus eryngii]
MGKSQKKRSMRRHNPVRVPDSHLPKGLAAASSSSTKTLEIPPIIQKMESPDASERKWACVAVSNLIHNDSSTRRLLQGKNVVGALITRLTDNEDEVVTEAMGTLRNLCIDGGFDICAEMYNKNILTPLKSFVPKISSTLSQFLAAPSTAPENSRNMVYEFADNVITTLWCLSETSNKALNAINQINLIPFLTSFLASHESLPLSPVIAAAQCLYVLTDGNPPAIGEVRADASHISSLLSIVQLKEVASNGKQIEQDGRRLTLRVLVTGVLRNVSPIPPPSVASSMDLDKDIILPLLQHVITFVNLVDTSQSVLALVSQQANEPPINKPPIKNLPKSDHKSDSERELERLENVLRTVQLALEIMTGMCAMLPDSEPHGDDEVEGDADLDEETEKPNSDAEMEEVGSTTTRTKPTFLPSLIPPLLSLIQPVALSFPPLASASLHPPTTSVLSAIHICALECLNNIFLALATSEQPAIADDIESGQRIWSEIWTALGSVGVEFGLGQERRKEMWEIAVGVMWGVSNVWKGHIVPDEEQIQVLIQFCDASTDPRTKVQCIGTLECMAQHPQSIEANKRILHYLLSLLPTSVSPSDIGTEPLIQVISSLIDIYSDEAMPYDTNFVQNGVLETLIASVDGVKKVVKAIDRKKQGGYDLKRRGMEIRDYLLAFIEYRRDLGR